MGVSLVKMCSKCKERKPISDFHKRSDTKEGLRSHCKVCTNSKTLQKYHGCEKNKTFTPHGL